MHSRVILKVMCVARGGDPPPEDNQTYGKTSTVSLIGCGFRMSLVEGD